jgi:purine-binding chemotaxis protein CheW
MAEKYCTFLLDGHLFGVPVANVQEVLRSQRVTAVPLAPTEIRGLLNLRGQIVTTIDLRARLGLQPSDDEDASVSVVVRTADGAVSLVVDRIGHVLEPPAASFEPAPDTVPESVRELVEHVCKLDDGLLLVLDTERTASAGAPA